MSIDVHRFRVLLRQAGAAADDGGRVAALRSALSLWRGPALSGVGPGTAAARLTAGLEESRLLAIEDELDVCLRSGGHREALDRLTGLVEAHPARERPIGQLMTALYLSGRAPEALEVFQRARRHLADEFGLTPGAELRRIETAILRGDESPLARPEGGGTAVREPAPGDGASPPKSADAEREESPALIMKRITKRLTSADPPIARAVTRLLNAADDLLA